MNINEDVSIITTVPKLTLDKLDEKRCLCICHAVDESIAECKDRCVIDIGIGDLVISLSDDFISYKFIPSSSLEEGLKKVVLEGKNPFENTLEEVVASRVINTYKDLF